MSSRSAHAVFRCFLQSPQPQRSDLRTGIFAVATPPKPGQIGWAMAKMMPQSPTSRRITSSLQAGLPPTTPATPVRRTASLSRIDAPYKTPRAGSQSQGRISHIAKMSHPLPLRQAQGQHHYPRGRGDEFRWALCAPRSPSRRNHLQRVTVRTANPASIRAVPAFSSPGRARWNHSRREAVITVSTSRA